MENESDRIILTEKQAKKLIGKRKDIHTFRSGTGILMGCDWSRKSLMEAIANSKLIEIGGDQCKKMGHGLVVWTSDYNPLFVEVDKEEIQKLENELTTKPLTL